MYQKKLFTYVKGPHVGEGMVVMDDIRDHMTVMYLYEGNSRLVKIEKEIFHNLIRRKLIEEVSIIPVEIFRELKRSAKLKKRKEGVILYSDLNH